MEIRPFHKKMILLAAVSIFIGGVLLSVRATPELISQVEIWPWSAFVAGAVLVTIFFNGYEYLLMARVLGQKTKFVQALEISIVASAANLLPLPGGLATKTIALKAGGSTVFQGVMVNLLFTLIWIALAFILTGLSLVAFAQTIFGPGLVATGCLALVSVLVLGPQRYGVPRGLLIKASVLRCTVLLLYAAMTCFAIQALGTEIRFVHSIVFTLASVLGAAFSVIPAGLGLREVASAAVAPMVSISPYVAFMAAALARTITMTILIPLSLLLVGRGNERGRKCEEC